MDNQTTELRAYIATRHKHTNNKGCWLNSPKTDWSLRQTGKFNGKVTALSILSAIAYLGRPWDSWLYVCHKCDVPGCFNPEHLFLGTASDNKKDCYRKFRPKLDSAHGVFCQAFGEHLNKLLDAYGL